MDKAQIISKVQEAGVVGAGGAGFPTHVKLNATVERVLANGASCEPLLMSDPYLMEARPTEILAGLQLAMAATGAGQGLVCLKGKHGHAMESVREALARIKDGLALFELEDFYPAGDEQVLVYEVTGRVVPEGGIPLMVGAVVSNVESLLNLAAAVEGKPVTHRYLTVCGEVARPMVTRVPLGVSLQEVIDHAGGPTVSDYRVVVGGPMMGAVAGDTTLPVTKTTSGVILLPAGHNVVADKEKDLAKVSRLARIACCQCSRCSDLCPRNLLGHGLYPHKIMRQLAAQGGPQLANQVDALICSECGICEKFACPMGLAPREINAGVKKQLMAAGIKRGQPRQEYHPSGFRDYRKIPTSRLMERLGVKRYDVHPPFVEFTRPVGAVRIPLKQHLGAPAQATVAKGDRVSLGQVIGEIPAGALGARVHASIAGTVTAVDGAVAISTS
ncbi:MAG: SLBB domain-containing protein [Deltaproteobacteria bacterium]|nr:SLBB domain-containing protein [Deltaproteobacteria bacterium]